MISQSGLVTLVTLVGLAGCAEGDNLFADASAAQSGVYAQRLTAMQQQVDAERSRTAALDAQNGELERRTAALDAMVDRERRDLAVLRGRVEQLDRDIRSRQVATAEAEAKRDELGRQLVGVRNEVAAIQRQLTGTSSDAELQQLKARKAELEEHLSKLAELYQALL